MVTLTLAKLKLRYYSKTDSSNRLGKKYYRKNVRKFIIYIRGEVAAAEIITKLGIVANNPLIPRLA